ncbi:TPA: glycosyltransferase family 4 protein [Serratia marcescens]|uniref:glycosyltransferase family 4 protein n=1 Tax=Serratia marcescens TaxID=615 RepID=UPI001BD406FB|nr:glycosyltransferase family 1 protein [Serratia marcescens]BEN34261.1 glycosyl transferase family 1 [Serratia marcescens]CAI1512803.1 Glycogen synthase [Serratia marcescens]CAI1720370.1 Glycogen synthase [Serratia marcescens]CAJ0994248.1 D-inositol-3-phosphate glycosyltransferase [Serratia marcescens]
MLFVNSRFLTQELTGVQRFAEQISLALKDIRDDVVFLSPPGVLRKDVAAKLQVREIGRKNGHYWEQIELPRFLKNNGSSLLLNLGSTAPVFYKNQIVTHHDVTYKRYPKSFSKKFRAFYGVMIPAMLKSSKRLLTVSEFSKGEINEVYGYPKDRISIIYNAVSDEFKRKKHTELNKTYLLAVSSPNFHKNFHGMLKAFELLGDKYNISLKIIGKTASSFAEQDFSALIKGTDKIEFMGRVDDDEMIFLYQNALAFVFPSFYEGFGIPPLEAQACGCPVISSNAASMPEVLRDSALYFSPENIPEMTSAMERIISDENIRAELINKGDSNVKRFSWLDSAIKINKIADELLKN